MSSDQQEIRAVWEERAVTRGKSLDAVLFARLPDAVNAHVHHWHCEIIKRELLPKLPYGARLLDLGCGYGRLSNWVKRCRPDITLVGVDFSQVFCSHYKDVAKSQSVCADIAHLPFANGCFDAILAVTVLMYLSKADALVTVEQLVQILRPDGALLLIDPGAEYLGCAKILGGKPTSTGGTGFKLREYTALAGRHSYSLGGMPGFSLSLPLIHSVRRSCVLLNVLLRLARYLDHLLPWGQRLTLHRWMLLNTQEAQK